LRAELYPRAKKRAIAKGYVPGSDDFIDFVNGEVQPRGIPPMVVEDVIRNSPSVPGARPGTFEHVLNRVKVVVNAAGDVITVYRF